MLVWWMNPFKEAAVPVDVHECPPQSSFIQVISIMIFIFQRFHYQLILLTLEMQRFNVRVSIRRLWRRSGQLFNTLVKGSLAAEISERSFQLELLLYCVC